MVINGTSKKVQIGLLRHFPFTEANHLSYLFQLLKIFRYKRECKKLPHPLLERHLLENRVFIRVRTSIDITTGYRMKAKGPLLMFV